VFYCRSGVAVQIAIRWPIEPIMSNNVVSAYALMEVRNIQNEQVAECSIKLGFGFPKTAFEIALMAVNSVRKAIDRGLVRFHNPDTSQDFQDIERENPSETSCSQSEVEQFIAGKAYLLGFMAADGLTEIWAVDPWDAKYLGVTTKELAVAMRSLQAKGLLQPGTNADYPRPTDKLLAEKSSENEDSDGFQSQQVVSRLNLPNKEELLKDMKAVLERHPISAIVVIDVDHFKQVNDQKGHLQGDACLDKVVTTIGAVVGRKGKVYRWGSGDEFVVCLPDFSTDEALVTAERIRCEVEKAKPGGDIAVTASIGVCGTDRTDSRSPDEILDFADKAM